MLPAWLLAAIVIVIVVIVIVIVVARSPRHGAEGLPGVPEWPLVGALPFLLRNRDNLQALTMTFAVKNAFKTMLITMPGRRVFMTSDVDDAIRILSDVENFQKGPRFRFIFRDLLGEGIFAADGDAWLKQRKAASHLFAAGRLKSFQSDVFSRDCDELANVLAAKAGEVVDLQNLLYALTFDSFCTLAFNHSTSALRETADARDNAKPAFLDAFDRAVTIITQRGSVPIPILRLMRWLQVGAEGQLVTHLKAIDTLVYGIVDKVLALSPEQLEARNDLLGLYAAHAHKTGDAGLLDRTFLRDVVVNFLLAGRDTTASTLTSLFRILSHHPVERARLEAEIDGLRGPLTVDALTKQLPFTEAVILETLRLFPPVFSDTKSFVGETPVKLPSGPIVRPDNVINYKIAAIQRNPAYWSHGDEFRPQRWIDKTDVMFSQPVEKHQYYFLAFHAGRRLCLGKGMALIEALTVVATLVRARLRFDLVDSTNDLADLNALTSTAVIALRKGLKVRVSTR